MFKTKKTNNYKSVYYNLKERHMANTDQENEPEDLQDDHVYVTFKRKNIKYKDESCCMLVMCDVTYFYLLYKSQKQFGLLKMLQAR